jgi:hypothetical protein
MYFHNFKHVIFFELTFERVIVASFVFEFFRVSSTDNDVLEHLLETGSIFMAAFFLFLIFIVGKDLINQPLIS